VSTLVSEERGEVLSSVEQDGVANTAQAAAALAQAAYALAQLAQAQGVTAEQRADTAVADAQAALALANAALAESDGDPKLPLAGGTLSGFLSLHANPTSAWHATPKTYVDTQFDTVLANYWPKTEVYTKSQSDNLYLTRSNPVVGGGPLTLAQDAASPMHAVTLQQANAALASSIPSGVIVMWSGSTAFIPAGWALCNGANGTPNLTNRFIIGAGSSYSPGNLGGSSSHTHTITINPHTLTLSQMPHHFHGIGVQTSESELPNQGFAAGGLFVNRIMVTGNVSVTFNQGGGQSHAHGATASGASSLPPFYALAYIIKL
jgi:hypothetical protein